MPEQFKQASQDFTGLQFRYNPETGLLSLGEVASWYLPKSVGGVNTTVKRSLGEDHDTLAFTNRASLTGAESLAAAEFIETVKQAGVWPKLVDVGLINMGTSGLVKLKYAVSGVPALVSSGSPTYVRGLGWAGNSAASLHTYVVPNAVGVLAASMSMGAYLMADDIGGQPMGGGQFFVKYDTGATYYSNVANDPANVEHPGLRERLVSVSVIDGKVNVYNSEELVGSAVANNTDSSTLITLLSVGAGDYLAAGYLSGYYIGKGLTHSDVAVLSRAFDQAARRAVQANLNPTYLGFGDSITAGTGASSVATRWLSIVAAAEGLTADFQGVGGSRMVPYGSETYWTRIIQRRPTKIAIPYGINDATNAIGGADFEIAEDKVVSRLVLYFDQAAITICSTPFLRSDLYGTYSVTRDTFINYRDAVRRIAVRYGVKFADLFIAMENAGGDTLMAGTDGIHPDDAGNRVIANTILAATVPTL